MKRAIGCAIALVVAGYVGILVHYHWFTPEGKMMWTPQGRDAWKKILAKHPDAVLLDWDGPEQSVRMDAENARLVGDLHAELTSRVEFLVDSIARWDSATVKDESHVSSLRDELRQHRSKIQSLNSVAACMERGRCRYCYVKIRTRGENATQILVVDDNRMLWRWYGREECNSFVGYFLR